MIQFQVSEMEEHNLTPEEREEQRRQKRREYRRRPEVLERNRLRAKVYLLYVFLGK